jgi:hypothetical protein
VEFEKRELISINFIGDGLTPSKDIVEEGDEAVLYHKGNLVLVNISSLKENQMVGTITSLAYDADPRSELTIGKEIQFLEENIFGISKMTKKA